MVYTVFYSGDTVPQGILCVLPCLPLVDEGAERRGEADYGKELSTFSGQMIKVILRLKKNKYAAPQK